MKVASKKIIHKTKVKGIRKGIRNKEQALKAFRELMKIRNAEGVLIQRQVKGKEFLLGIKKTPEFGYVTGFGKGGSKVEKMKKVDFRVCDVKGVEKLSKNPKIKKILLKLCSLSDLGIESLDINPLILERDKPIIVDAQIVFE
jgi:acetyltransferase